MSKVDWKQKYYELRSKYMNAIDVAFRLGVQEGQKNEKIMSMETQLQQMQEAAMMGNGQPSMEGGQPGMEGEQPGMEGEQPGMEGEQPGMESQSQGDELDASIDELEQYVKSEKKDYTDLLKSFHKQKESKNIKEKKKKAKEISSLIEKWEDEEEENLSGQSTDFIDQDSSAEEGTDSDDIIGQA